MRKLALTLLVFAALAVPCASASASNTTGFLCMAVSSGATFSDSSCSTAVGGGAGYVHASFGENTSIVPSIVNVGMAATFRTNIAGVEVMIECTTASGSGIFNTQGEPAEPAMHTWGEELKITFSGCTVEQPTPCTVSGGTITTEPLFFTTQGQEMGVKFQPQVASSPLAKITLDNCAGAGTVTFSILGSVVLTPNHTTLTSTEAGTTAQGTLTISGGHRVGLTSNLRFIDNGFGIAFTT